MFCHSCGMAHPTGALVCSACHQQLLPAPSDGSAAQPDTFSPGALLKNRYEIVARVGEGGFGTVHRAFDTQDNNRPVALKLISMRELQREELLDASEAVNREVRVLSTLRHSNLPRLYDYFMINDCWCLVMDFIEGQTLRAYLEREWLLDKQSDRTLEKFLEIARQLCTVLAYLHTQDPPFIFRDLKPENIMLTPDGRVYLIDFGIARRFVTGQHKDTAALGSPGYAAPEQYGKEQTTPRADIYSLGVIWHEMLTGHDPSETPFRFAAVRASNPAVSSRLETLILQMVDLDPARRPGDVREVQKRLLSVTEPAGIGETNREASQKPSAPFPPVPQRRSPTFEISEKTPVKYSGSPQPSRSSPYATFSPEELERLREVAEREERRRKAQPFTIVVAVISCIVIVGIGLMGASYSQEQQQNCVATVQAIQATQEEATFDAELNGDLNGDSSIYDNGDSGYSPPAPTCK